MCILTPRCYTKFSYHVHMTYVLDKLASLKKEPGEVNITIFKKFMGFEF